MLSSIHEASSSPRLCCHNMRPHLVKVLKVGFQIQSAIPSHALIILILGEGGLAAHLWRWCNIARPSHSSPLCILRYPWPSIPPPIPSRCPQSPPLCDFQHEEKETSRLLTCPDPINEMRSQCVPSGRHRVVHSVCGGTEAESCGGAESEFGNFHWPKNTNKKKKRKKGEGLICIIQPRWRPLPPLPPQKKPQSQKGSEHHQRLQRRPTSRSRVPRPRQMKG